MAKSGEYIFAGEKTGEGTPYLGFYSQLTSPTTQYDILFSASSNLKYVAAAKLTTYGVMAYNSNRLIVSLLGPPTQTDDMSLLITNPWSSVLETYENVGFFKVSGLNDKRRAISNSNFILLDTDVSTHHEVKAIMTNEDDASQRFNVFLVQFQIPMSSGSITVTSAKKVSSIAMTSAYANFLVEKKQMSSTTTEIILGGPCDHTVSGTTYSSCLFKIETDLSTMYAEATLFRHATTPSGYVETLDFFEAYDMKYVGVMVQKDSPTATTAADTSEGLTVVLGCDSSREFLSAELNFLTGSNKKEVLALTLDMAGTWAILLRKGTDSAFYMLQGIRSSTGTDCDVANNNQLSSLYNYEMTITPPSGETFNQVLTGFVNMADIYVGYQATASDGKDLTIY
mmetsp:Transcript_26731/g.40780  ORF Transcript_26731/g.40780 Transcript_26731/m.40780 type:complete len:397 (-) Transcript_26731:2350-3540(-)